MPEAISHVPEELSDEDLDAAVRQELAELTGEFSAVTKGKLLFYLAEHQELGDQAETVLDMLVQHGFLKVTEDGKYEPLTESPAVAPPEIIKPAAVRRPRPRRVAQVALAPLQVAPSPPLLAVVATPEAAPPPKHEDEPFSIEDRSYAMLLLNRLSRAEARAQGVPVSTLVRFLCEDDSLNERHARSIIGRMWWRGHLERDTSDPEDSRMSLVPDLNLAPEELHRLLPEVMSALARPFEPPTAEAA